MSKENKTYNWQKIWSCEDGMEAQLIKNLLEIKDIPVKLYNVNTNSIFPDTGVAEVDILVPHDQAERATGLIKEHFD